MTQATTDKTAGTNLRVVLYEGPGSTALAGDERFEITSWLLERGFEVTRPDARGEVVRTDASSMVVLGRFDGAPPQVESLEGGGEIRFENIDGLDVETMGERVLEARDGAGARDLGQWKPWFPVIDFDRCTNCMQCLTFCLFDVYGVDQNKTITVQNESNCKTGCPACSRVCPEVAILFPKYKKGPINGDEVRQEDVQREAMKVDISTLLGGDLYGSLRERSEAARKRFSTERDESRALLERKRCLNKLKKDLDIPDEVLMTLPSAGDIEERTARAKAKLEKRRAESQSVRDQQQQRPAPSEDDWGI